MTSMWLSLGMAVVCLGAAFLYQPYWIGAVGAVAASIAERKRPRLGVWWDDNANVVAVSLIAMAALTFFVSKIQTHIWQARRRPSDLVRPLHGGPCPCRCSVIP
ncbi:MAG: hypothetical protein QF717_00345 [SAR202 cluster bacterium]|nr:hypothetical protein [SAR202 cluster bacterium]